MKNTNNVNNMNIMNIMNNVNNVNNVNIMNNKTKNYLKCIYILDILCDVNYYLMGMDNFDVFLHDKFLSNEKIIPDEDLVRSFGILSLYSYSKVQEQYSFLNNLVMFHIILSSISTQHPGTVPNFIKALFEILSNDTFATMMLSNKQFNTMTYLLDNNLPITPTNILLVEIKNLLINSIQNIIDNTLLVKYDFILPSFLLQPVETLPEVKKVKKFEKLLYIIQHSPYISLLLIICNKYAQKLSKITVKYQSIIELLPDKSKKPISVSKLLFMSFTRMPYDNKNYILYKRKGTNTNSDNKYIDTFDPVDIAIYTSHLVKKESDETNKDTYILKKILKTKNSTDVLEKMVVVKTILLELIKTQFITDKFNTRKKDCAQLRQFIYSISTLSNFTYHTNLKKYLLTSGRVVSELIKNINNVCQIGSTVDV